MGNEFLVLTDSEGTILIRKSDVYRVASTGNEDDKEEYQSRISYRVTLDEADSDEVFQTVAEIQEQLYPSAKFSDPVQATVTDRPYNSVSENDFNTKRHF